MNKRKTGFGNLVSVVATLPVPKSQISHTDDAIIGHQMDITGATNVHLDVSSDGKVVWVNVDGVCRLRICRIEQLAINHLARGRDE